jgi:hypothetical protein
MPWRDFLCKQILGQINKLRVFLWNIFIIDKLNDSNSHHAMWHGKEHECIQTTGAPWLSESNAKHHLRASSHSEELPLSSAIFYPFHTSVMMSITQFLSPVLHCEATIVKILHTLSAPSLFLKPDASHVTKMKWCQGTLLSPSPSTQPCWCQKELTRIRITYTGDRNPNSSFLS